MGYNQEHRRWNPDRDQWVPNANLRLAWLAGDVGTIVQEAERVAEALFRNKTQRLAIFNQNIEATMVRKMFSRASPELSTQCTLLLDFR